MAFPAIGNSAIANGVASAAVAKPSGLSVGDLMIAWAAAGDQTNSGVGPTAPDGTWTPLLSGTGTGVGSNSRWKSAPSTNVAASTFTFTTTEDTNASLIQAGIIQITGTDPTTPINASNHATGTTSNSLSTTGITPNPLQ